MALCVIKHTKTSISPTANKKAYGCPNASIEIVICINVLNPKSADLDNNTFVHFQCTHPNAPCSFLQ